MTASPQHALAPQDADAYVTGAIDTPLLSHTIPQLLHDAVAQHGDRQAAYFAASDTRLSYRELGEMSDALAYGLLSIGIERGDRVGIWSPNRVEWVLLQFATARIGAILVTINPAYRSFELAYALNKVGCKALVMAPRFKTSDYLSILAELAPEMGQASPGELHAVKVPELRYVIVLGAESPPGTLPFDTLMQPLDAAQRRQLDTITAGLKSDDPINIQFTSGTTGMPKGATLSHANIVNNARFVTDRICLNPTDRLVIPVPLYHCFGMVMGVLGAVSKGAAMVFPGEGFQAEQTLDVIAAERGTALYSVPTMFIAMLEQLEVCHRDMSSLRTGIMAGSPCPIDVMHRVNDVMHMREVTICYGMTETSPVSFQSFTDDPIDKRCETVGRVHPHLAVKIVDPDGNTVPVGHKGELCTRGYAVMLGYWEDSAATDSSVIDDWMHTGDLATLDADGYCTIVGRAKDMIIRGGENIYPREIEEFLIRHPKVMDAQVFGIPDDIYGEQVCAWVTHKPNTEDIAGGELIEYCKGKIAHFKLPAHVVVVESLPMTVTGKAQKYIMREKMQEMLSCDAHAISNRTA